ncbi:response regulator [Flammeovirga yaeyamensis]|uniref:Response regulator n=1 Tax=Flammeovirga yaeyamensis TaxID=367791 RepID=A0AAX1N4L5_9BACT|nr:MULTISPECIES: response regulator [Flammeovirga]ANQ50129.1 response regulator [Flammeovirga sp. MY04]MBB3700347.1 CheY-like chemotaxis protein [Flammeovirga yaeyamensis]NMF37027.1 response regulator [Flammeovirga yaeyamensis]QWG02430.1 response regulator [Flammeovirga yaeyamensis]
MALANSLDKPTTQKAIVVDDNIINAHYLKKMLADEGMIITVVSDSANLTQLILESDTKIVFLNSETLSSQFQETVNSIRVAADSVVIVGTTPYSLEGARKKLISMGAEFALSTPIYKKHLKGILNKVSIA